MTAARGYEENREEHHHHLIDVNSGVVIEFTNDELEKIKARIADELGYQLIGDRLDCTVLKKGSSQAKPPSITVPKMMRK